MKEGIQMHQLLLHSDFKLIFTWGGKTGCAVNNYTGISPTKYGKKQNTKHTLEPAAPVQAHAQAKAITSAVNGAQGCLLSGNVTTFPVPFSTRGSDFGTLREFEHCFTLSHNLECSRRIIGLLKL